MCLWQVAHALNLYWFFLHFSCGAIPHATYYSCTFPISMLSKSFESNRPLALLLLHPILYLSTGFHLMSSPTEYSVHLLSGTLMSPRDNGIYCLCLIPSRPSALDYFLQISTNVRSSTIIWNENLCRTITFTTSNDFLLLRFVFFASVWKLFL
jgi:hypothetical protein